MVAAGPESAPDLPSRPGRGGPDRYPIESAPGRRRPRGRPRAVPPSVLQGVAAGAAALVPPEGGNGLDCMKPAHREGLIATVEAAHAAGDPPPTLPGAPTDPEPFRTAYGGDPLTDDQLAFVVDPARCVPDTVHHYFQPVRWSVAGAVPVTYVHTLRDRPVRPEAQRDFLARLPWATVVELDTGHLPMVTDPERLAAVIATAS